MTIQEFIAKHHIEMKSVKIEQNPYTVDRKSKADHYEVTFTRRSRYNIFLVETKLVTYFSKGIGHKSERPRADEVLDCLILDSDALEYEFDKWCLELGYDEDSRQAYKTYTICLDIGKQLKAFLSEEAFYELKECERL